MSESKCPVDHGKKLPEGHPPISGATDKCPVAHDTQDKFVKMAQALNNKKSSSSSNPLVPGAPLLTPPSSPAVQVQDTKQDTKQDVKQALACDSSNLSSVGSSPNVVNDAFPDAKPLPGQRYSLSTDAVKSSIPKGGAPDPSAVWEFPSVQRFFNAMHRKGWNPKEEQMHSVVSIHNTVNEQCWREVLKFEKAFHADECNAPKLLRFRGRPQQYSPKARIMNMFGYVLPFDRHDWIVDRCGKEVRYVIDFYSGNPRASTTPWQSGAPSIYLDVRPALTFEGFVDRLRMQFRRWLGQEK